MSPKEALMVSEQWLGTIALVDKKQHTNETVTSWTPPLVSFFCKKRRLIKSCIHWKTTFL